VTAISERAFYLIRHDAALVASRSGTRVGRESAARLTRESATCLTRKRHVSQALSDLDEAISLAQARPANPPPHPSPRRAPPRSACAERVSKVTPPRATLCAEHSCVLPFQGRGLPGARAKGASCGAARGWMGGEGDARASQQSILRSKAYCAPRPFYRIARARRCHASRFTRARAPPTAQAGAIEMFDKALALNPKYVPSLYHLGLMYHAEGEHEQAARPLPLFRLRWPSSHLVVPCLFAVFFVCCYLSPRLPHDLAHRAPHLAPYEPPRPCGDLPPPSAGGANVLGRHSARSARPPRPRVSRHRAHGDF
jgi:tetratricopeptide (TPR) repeat protein